MPISRNETSFSPGSYGASDPRVPTTPAFSENFQWYIETGTNDVLAFTSSEGSSTVTLTQSIYNTGALLATELQTQMNADTTLTGSGTITFSVSYSTSTNLFTIDAASGNTIQMTGVGSTSTAASEFGYTADTSATQSVVSDTLTYGSGTITFYFTANGNSNVVEYAIYESTTGKYIGTDGKADDTSEAWQTFANWDDGGADGYVTAVGLTGFTAYNFRIKAKNEEGAESDWSAYSADMNTMPAVDYGQQSAALEREIATGNTKIGVDGVTDSDSTTYTILPSGSTGGDPSGYYGDVTFTYLLKNPASTTSRIVVEYSEDNSTWNTATEGTGGDGISGLTTSAAGVEHTFVWDSYTDVGKSQLDQTVYIRITPYDASPSGGDAGAIRTSDAFSINNRPAQITLANADGYSFAKDTTPQFIATMGAVRGGDKLFFRLKVYDPTSTLVLDAQSPSNATGWEYEQATGDWHDVPLAGVDVAYSDGTNRVRYTVQASDALSADNDDNYTVYIYQGEVRNV